MLMALLHRALSDDPVMRAFTLAWAIVCVLAIGLHVRARARQVAPVQ
jgi:hypothetical protein